MRLRTVLPNPSERVQRILVGLWIALAAIAAFVQVAGIRTAWVQYHTVAPAFGWIGLTSDYDSLQGATAIDTVYADDEWEGYDGDAAPVLAVDGKSVVGRTPAEIAPMLPARDGAPVTFTLRDARGKAFQYEAEASQEQYDAVMEPQSRRSDAIEMIAWPPVAIPFLLAGALLLWRLRGQAVPLLISFSFAVVAALSPGGLAFMQELGLGWVLFFFMLVALGCFAVALPAFPDGRYVHALGRWLLPLTIASWPIAVLVSQIQPATGVAILVIPVFIGIALLAARYRHTPRGIARQQIKWATFGVVGGTIVIGASIAVGAIYNGTDRFSETTDEILFVVSVLLNVTGFVLIPLGFIMSLMRWRLNDADMVIGRSFGYAGVTLFMGVFFAVTTTLVNGWLNRFIGVSNPAATTAIGTVMAALVFTPARARVTNWVEKKFQAALLRLKSLPARLARRQAVETPEALATQALTSVVKAIDATHGAILWHDTGQGEPFGRVLAVDGFDAEAALAGLLGERPASWVDDPFPLRLPLRDDGVEKGVLALGTRGDGSTYSKPEIKAVESVLGPLAEAIDAAERQASSRSELVGHIGQLQVRLDAMEAPAIAAA